MAVCENYRCLQRRRECKKLFQGWSKQLLTLVGMETVLEGFVGEEVTSFLIQKPTENAPRDFDSNEKFCFYDNDHEIGMETCNGKGIGSDGYPSSAIGPEAPNSGAAACVNEDTHTDIEDSQLLFSNLGSTGGPLGFSLHDETGKSVSMRPSEGLEEDIRSVVDASNLLSALHHRSQTAAAAVMASHYLTQQRSNCAATSNHLLSSTRGSADLQTGVGIANKSSDMKTGLPQDEPLDLSTRPTKAFSQKPVLNGTQDTQSHASALKALGLLNASSISSNSIKSSLNHMKQELSEKVAKSDTGGGKTINSSPNRQHNSGSHSGAPVRKSYTEAELTKAVRAILQGKLGTRRASAEFGIPRSTLRNKICKLNEMKRKEEESTGKRIEMEEFLESVINTPIFQVNCRREIAPAKMVNASRLPNSSSSLMDSPNITKKTPFVEKQSASPLSSGSPLKPSTVSPTSPVRQLSSNMSTADLINSLISQEHLKDEEDGVYSQQWNQSNIVSSMVEVAKRCLSMSEDEKATYLDQQYRKYGHAYTASFVHYIPWFMVSMFSNPTIMENFGGALNNNNSFASSSSSTPSMASVPNASSFSLLDGFLNQCAASAMTSHFPDHSNTVPNPDRCQDLSVGRSAVPDVRTTNHSSSSTEPASSVAMETAETTSYDSWSSCPSPDPCETNEGSERRKHGGSRAKRGQYRRYNSATLMEAVNAVTSGLMTVHKAGNHFGVPHSTLEYKVKERFLRQRKRESETEGGLGSPTHSPGGGANGRRAGGVIFPGMEEDGEETEEEEVPVPVSMEMESKGDGGEVADRSPSLSPSLSDSC